MYSTLELTDLKLNTDIGTYGADDVVTSAHLLNRQQFMVTWSMVAKVPLFSRLKAERL